MEKNFYRLCLVAMLLNAVYIVPMKADETVEAESEAFQSSEQTSGFLSEFKNNAHYTLIGRSNFFHQNQLADKKKTYLDLVLKGNSFAKLTSSSTLYTTAYLAYTRPSGAMRGSLSNPENTNGIRKFIDVIEFYSKTQYDQFDVSLGKTLFTNTVSEINSVSDIYNGLNVAGFQNPITVGQWAGRIDYYTENEDQWTLALMPFEVRPNAVSNGATRWYTNFGGYTEPLGYNLSANSTILESEYNQPKPPAWNFLTRYSGSRGGLDFFTTAFYGTAAFAVLENTNTAQQYRLVRPKATQITGGLSKVLNNHRAYSEILYQYTLQNEDDHFYQVLGGIFSKFTGSVPNFLKLQEINTTLEISHDETTRKQRKVAQFYASSRELRRNADNITGQIALVVQPGLTGYFGKNYNYKDKGSAYFVGTQVYLSETFFLHLTYTAFSGNEGTSTFGSMQRNKNTVLSFNWRF